MSENRIGRKLFGPIAVVLCIYVGYQIFGPRKENIDDATRDGHVSVEINPEGENSAGFNLHLLPSGPAKVTLVIAAGTVIANSNTNGQWLMTAHTVTVVLTRNNPNTHAQIPTYCLDQFAMPPDANSNLKLSNTLELGNKDGMNLRETEPLRKLASCMDELGDDSKTKQLAVWMIGNDLVNQTYDQVQKALQAKYTAQAHDKEEGVLEGSLDELRRKFPNLSEQQLQDEIEEYKRTRLEQEIEVNSAKHTAEELKSFLDAAKPILDRCGQQTSEMNFFKTAPQG